MLIALSFRIQMESATLKKLISLRLSRHEAGSDKLKLVIDRPIQRGRTVAGW
jgi:hypothetical protein